MDEPEEFEDAVQPPDDDWEDFRGEDRDPIGVEELKGLDLQNLPEDVHIAVMDDYFPETTIWREGDHLICEIQEHLYTKYWDHKFSAYAFAEAMERAVRRLAHEGHPFAEPSRDDEDVHIFVGWKLKLPRDTAPGLIPASIKAAFDLVWHRADSILENSDSVLILGKDSGPALDRLKRIAARLEETGYYTYIIKEQPDRPGEGKRQDLILTDETPNLILEHLRDLRDGQRALGSDIRELKESHLAIRHMLTAMQSDALRQEAALAALCQC